MPIHLQKVVKTLHTTIYAKVQINGDTHGEVMSNIGVEQGCPISPTLFGMYIDKFEKNIWTRSMGILCAYLIWQSPIFFMLTMIMCLKSIYLKPKP